MYGYNDKPGAAFATFVSQKLVCKSMWWLCKFFKFFHNAFVTLKGVMRTKNHQINNMENEDETPRKRGRPIRPKTME